MSNETNATIDAIMNLAELHAKFEAEIAAGEIEYHRWNEATDKLRAMIAAALDSQARQIEALTAERDELRKRLDDAKPAAPVPGEWVEWRGGVAPVADGTLVEIRNRRGTEWSRYTTPDLDWSYITHFPMWSDIVAYRIIK